MTVKELATALKRRQQHYPSRGFLRLMDAEDMLWSYLTCADCQHKLIVNFIPLVQAVKSGQEFAEYCNVLIAIHQIEFHGAIICEDDPDDGKRVISADELRSELPPGVIV